MKVDIKSSKIAIRDMKAGNVFRDGNLYWLVTEMTMPANQPDVRMCVDVESGACYNYACASQFEVVDAKMVLT